MIFVVTKLVASVRFMANELWHVVGALVRGLYLVESHTIDDKARSIVANDHQCDEQALVAAKTASFVEGLLHCHAVLLQLILPATHAIVVVACTHAGMLGARVLHHHVHHVVGH